MRMEPIDDNERDEVTRPAHDPSTGDLESTAPTEGPRAPDAETASEPDFDMTDPTPPTADEPELFEDPDDADDLSDLRETLGAASPGCAGRLGRFEVIRRIGRGGMGQVLLARDTANGQEVALKVIDPGHVSDPRVRHAFVKEAKHMHAMRHPNILPVNEIVDDERSVFYVMPFVRGGSLASKARSGRPVNLDKLLPVAIQVARALEYAHDKHGVVHRDIKPENVLLEEGGQVARLCDFGLVRTMFNDTVTNSTPRMGWRIGTRPYMAPEVVEGKAGDYRVDIYSFGAMLYQLVTGRRPYAGADTEEIFAKIKLGPPPPLKELNPALPKAWVTVIEGAMQRELSRRYAHMADLRADLERIQRGERPLGPTQQRSGSRPIGLFMGAAAGVLLVAGAIAALALVPWPGPEERSAPVVTQGPPVIEITAPEATTFSLGEAITFSASATDPDDGDLRQRITWRSDLDGLLGRGANVKRDDLSAGIHVVTATVADDDDIEAIATIRIRVEDPEATPDARLVERYVRAVEDRDERVVREIGVKLQRAWIDPDFPHALRDRLNDAVVKAAIEGNVAVFKAMHETGAPLRWSDAGGRTPIHLAALHDRAELVATLLELDPALAGEQTDATRLTPLHIAASSMAHGAMAALLEGGADPNARSAARSTPLHEAARHTDAEAIRILVVAEGCEVDAIDQHGRTALHYAAEQGHEASVRRLLVDGADPRVRDDRGSTAADLARASFHDGVAAIIEGA